MELDGSGTSLPLETASSIFTTQAWIVNPNTGEVEKAIASMDNEVEVINVETLRSAETKSRRKQVLSQPVQPLLMSRRPLRTAPAMLRNSKRLRACARSESMSVAPTPHIASSARMPPSSIDNFSGFNRVSDIDSTVTYVNAGSVEGQNQIIVVSDHLGVPDCGNGQDEASHSSITHVSKEGFAINPDTPAYILCHQGMGIDTQMTEASNNVLTMDESSQLICQFEEDGSVILIKEDAQHQITQGAPNKTETKKSKKRKTNVLPKEPKICKRKNAKELKCLEEACPVLCYNVIDLRKHLSECHSFQFDEEAITFPDDKAFKVWREQYEHERMVSFIYRGGTKKVAKNQAVTYMICHRSGHYKPTVTEGAMRQRKMKPQGSCKMGGHCTAGIKLLKNLENGEVTMHICHTHYGHPLDSEAIPHLRVNPTLRKIILKKFQEGMSFADVLGYIHHNPDGLEGLRLVDRRAVRNIYDAWKHPIKRTRKDSEQEHSPKKSKHDNVNKSSHISLENSSAIQSTTVPKGIKTYPPHKNAKKQHDGCEDSEDGNCDNRVELKIASVTSSISPGSAFRETPKYSKCTEGEKSQFFVAPEVEKNSYGSVPKDKTSEKNIGGASSNGPSKVKRWKIVPDHVERKLQNKTFSSKSSISKTKKQPNPSVNKKTENFTLVSVSAPTDPQKSAKKEDNNNTKSNTTTKTTNCPSIKKTNKMENNCDSLTTPRSVKSSKTPTGENGIEQAVKKLANHGESGPTVLLYKQVGLSEPTYGSTFTRSSSWREGDFCLVLQTPIQRQLLQMFPQIVGIEILDGLKPNKPNSLKLLFIMILDEFREPIPVVWMVANSMDGKHLTHLFKTLKSHCGDLPTEFLMAAKDSDIHRYWCATFSNKPRFILNEFEARRDIRTSVYRAFPVINSDRETAWKYVESLLKEKDSKKFEILSTNFKQFFKQTTNSETFVKTFSNEWLSCAKEWAICFRMNCSVNTIFAADAFLRLRKFIGFKGTKYLNSSIDHILKIGYDKCFLRSKRLFKGDQKLSQHFEDILIQHQKAVSTLKYEYVTSNDHEQDKYSWTVTIPDVSTPFYVHDTLSPCSCKIKCKRCEVCLHKYICSCEEYTVGQKMCQHIHLVHSFRLGVPLDYFEFVVTEFESRNGGFEDSETKSDPTEIFEDRLHTLAICMTDEEERNEGSDNHNIRVENAIDIDDVLEAAGLLQDCQDDILDPADCGHMKICPNKTDGDMKKILLDRTTVQSSDNSKQTVLIFTAEEMEETNESSTSGEAILRFVEKD